MFKREMKVNFKTFMIWSLVLVLLFLVVFLVYPTIINSENMKMIDDMMQMFPEEILKAFNMDISSIDTAFGWLKSEGVVFVLLITGVYSGILGSSILTKEENDKTIEYLNSLPITRNHILLNKLLCGFTYIFFMVFILGVFNYVCLLLSGEFNQNLYILLSITPLFSSIVIFSICLFLSTFTHKTNKIFGISLGFVFVSYFIQILSEMSESVQFLKYLSVFTFADIRNVILDEAINPFMIILSVVITIIFINLTKTIYNRKELV